MLKWSIEAAQASRSIGRVIVSTDGEEIEKCAVSCGADVFRHPPHLSTDGARTLPVIQWNVQRLAAFSARPRLIVVLRATTPFRTSDDLDSAITLLDACPEADSIVSVVQLQGGHPKRLKLIDRNGWIVDAFETEGMFPIRRQEVEPVYVRNGGLYATTPDVVLAGGLWGQRCLAYEMPSERSLNINTSHDYQIAQFLASRPTTSASQTG